MLFLLLIAFLVICGGIIHVAKMSGLDSENQAGILIFGCLAAAGLIVGMIILINKQQDHQMEVEKLQLQVQLQKK